MKKSYFPWVRNVSIPFLTLRRGGSWETIFVAAEQKMAVSQVGDPFREEMHRRQCQISCFCVCDLNIDVTDHFFNRLLQKRELQLSRFYEQQEQRTEDNARTVDTLTKIRAHLPRFAVRYVVHKQRVVYWDDDFDYVHCPSITCMLFVIQSDLHNAHVDRIISKIQQKVRASGLWEARVCADGLWAGLGTLRPWEHTQNRAQL